MRPRTDEWSTVWAEYDARAGAPKWQAHTPWYMVPEYAMGADDAEAGSDRGRPWLTLASVAMVFLAFMLNIRFVPEAPRHAAAPWQPVVPVAMLSLGAPAEAAPAALRPAGSGFGTWLDLPPPDWVRAEATGNAPEPPQQAGAGSRALPSPGPVARAASPAPHAAPARRVATARLAVQPHCAPAAAARQQRPVAAAAGQAAARQAPQVQAALVETTAMAPPLPSRRAAAARSAGQRHAGAQAMAAAPRAPPGGQVRI